MTDRRRELRAGIAEHCVQIEKWFLGKVAITVFVRDLETTDGTRDVLVTSDLDTDAMTSGIRRVVDTGEVVAP